MKRVPDIAMDFMGRGGKRLRPRICEAAWRSLSGGDASRVAPLAEAVECLHKASLIHDDIQDSAPSRYGAPSVWAEHGVPIAVAAGDWLLARGIALVADSDFPNAAEMSRLVSRTVLALCEGQGDELSGHAGYVSICERKTGSLFALAAALGALAAGADPAPYWRWGVDFGVLFQAMDDIRDDGETPLLAAVRDEYRAKLPSHALLSEFGDALCR